MTTEVFCDREFSTEGTSSVIRHVYYSTKERKLFVELVHGYVIAGYNDVGPEIFNMMDRINSNRIAGLSGNSVGNYWNTSVKPYFGGIETDDLDIITQSDREKQAVAKEKLNRPEELLHFGVTFDDGEENTLLSVKATDYQQAIDKVHRAAQVLGWEPVTIVSVTLFLEA